MSTTEEQDVAFEMPKLKKTFMSADVLSNKLIRSYQRHRGLPHNRLLELSKTDPDMKQLFVLKNEFEKDLRENERKLKYQKEFFSEHAEKRRALEGQYEEELNKLKATKKNYTSQSKISEVNKSIKTLKENHEANIKDWTNRFEELDDQTVEYDEAAKSLALIVKDYNDAVQLRLERDLTWIELVEDGNDFYIENFDEFFELVFEPIPIDILHGYNLDQMLTIVTHFFESCSANGN